MESITWVQILSLGVDFSVIVVGIKLIRHLSRMELKVDVMWAVFIRRFGSRSSEGIENGPD